MKNDKKMNISFTLYTKGNNNNWYCDYVMYNYENYESGTTRARGYGYDKHSTALSNAINRFSKYYKRYNKKAKKYTSYGLYEDNTISYGIGMSAVLKCLKCFKNVKIKSVYYGRSEDNLKIEVLKDE